MKVLKFGAIWCPACLVMRPIFKKIELEMPELVVENYDYDMDSETVNKWDIGRKLPVYIFLDNNDKEITRLIGEHKKEEIIELINKCKE